MLLLQSGDVHMDPIFVAEDKSCKPLLNYPVRSTNKGSRQ